MAGNWNGDGAVYTVEEYLDEEFKRVHMQTLRYYISQSHVHEQLLSYHSKSAIEMTEDERDTLEEFEIELSNLHGLLVNEHLRVAEVLHAAHKSLDQYVSDWPGAKEATERWWQAREDKATAVRADLQFVLPGLWIGSSVTVKPHLEELLLDKQIRHVVYCKSSKPDNDEDFLHGSERATDRGLETTVAQFPLIEHHGLVQSQHHHTITLFELGQMEFLLRRRENSLPSSSTTTTAIGKICDFLHGILESLKQNQYRSLDAEDTESPFVSQFDGLLLYCDSGVSTSIAVCTALVMFELRLPYDMALRLIHCARRYVGPSECFEHQLRAFHQCITTTPHTSAFRNATAAVAESE